MTDGRAPGPSGSPPLPGIAPVRVRGEGRRGHTEAIIESPKILPSPDETLWGLPHVYDDHGNIVDHWANLTWLFANAYTPDWTNMTLLRAEMSRRRFSWAGLRLRTGKPGATLDNLDRRFHKLLEQIFTSTSTTTSTNRCTSSCPDAKSP